MAIQETLTKKTLQTYHKKEHTEYFKTNPTKNIQGQWHTINQKTVQIKQDSNDKEFLKYNTFENISKEKQILPNHKINKENHHKT